MDKDKRNQRIGILICAGIILWAHYYDYQHNPQLGQPGYLEYCDRTAKAPWFIVLGAFGTLILGLWAISLLFKYKHRFWTFWFLHVFLGSEFSALYLIFLWVKKHFKRLNPVMSVVPDNLRMKGR